MPRFRVRLEDGAGEFRLASLTAVDEAAARAAVERLEHKRAAYQLAPPLLEEMEAEEAADGPTGAQTRWALVVHRQAAPYEIVSVKEL